MTAPLKVMLPVVLFKAMVPALIAPLKDVPAELVKVMLPLPANDEPVIVPAVPAFNVSALPPDVIAPIPIVLPADEPPLFVVSIEDVPVKVTAPSDNASADVLKLPLIVVVLEVDVKPPLKRLVPAKVTPPVFEKVAVLVIVLPLFNKRL